MHLKVHKTMKLITIVIAENGLSFIETSALDASNVEGAFQTILTGELHVFVHTASGFSSSFLLRYLPNCLKQVA